MKKQTFNFLFILLVAIIMLVGFTATASADSTTTRVNGVIVKVNGIEQPVGTITLDADDEITFVFYGDNFNKLYSNYKYKIGSRSGSIGTYGFFTVDTASTPNTATKTFTTAQIKHSTFRSVSYTNQGESETVTGYTLAYDTDAPVVVKTAKVNGVTVKVNGVEQAVGEVTYTDGDEISVIFYGENFDKLTTDYRYVIGASSGPIGTYGFFTVDTSSTPHTATKTYTSAQIQSSTKKSITYTNAGESETDSGYTLTYVTDEPVVIPTAKVNGVTVKLNGVEQEAGEISFTDGDEITLVFYGENFDKLTTDYTYVIGSASGAIGSYGFFTVDTDATPNTATKTFTSAQIKSETKKSISYTNAGESEIVTGYTLAYASDEPVVNENAKVNGVTVKVNGVEQEEGAVSFTDGDEISVVYYGENFDKLTSEYKYVIGPSAGTIGIYGFFTVDTSSIPHTATKTYTSAQIKHSTMKSISYTNAGESETVSGYILEYKEPHTHDYNSYGYCSGCQVNIKGVSITVGASLSVNYYIELIDDTLVQDTESLVMKFTKNGKTTDVITGELQSDGLYKFVYENVAPQCMTDSIDSALYIANGDALTQIAGHTGYTIRENAESLLQLYADDEKLVSLVTEMLYYGKSAQEYRGYNTEDLATDGVSGLAEQGTAFPDTTKKNLVNNSDGTAKLTAVGVWFDSVNKIYVKLNTIDGVTLKVNGEAVTLSDTVYYTDGILATEFDNEYKFELYEGETLIQALTYSINSYVYSMKNNSNMSELVKALYNYGLAAKAYAE